MISLHTKIGMMNSSIHAMTISSGDLLDALKSDDELASLVQPLEIIRSKLLAILPRIKEAFQISDEQARKEMFQRLVAEIKIHAKALDIIADRVYITVPSPYSVQKQSVFNSFVRTIKDLAQDLKNSVLDYP